MIMMGYTRIFNYIFFVLIFILSGCNLFKSTKVPSSEIKSASSWSSNDENPSYSECEDLNKKENFDCFGSIVSESIIKYISEEVFDVNVEINEDIKLVINIDKEGFFSLLSIDASDFVKNNIEGIEEIIENAIYNIPQALPAVKVNVEEYVDVKFELPIRIISQESI
tara:strand:- start:452 stop:952 length:501 start_codon:yes stop_codon:yes gene_type:complete